MKLPYLQIQFKFRSDKCVQYSSFPKKHVLEHCLILRYIRYKLNCDLPIKTLLHKSLVVRPSTGRILIEWKFLGGSITVCLQLTSADICLSCHACTAAATHLACMFWIIVHSLFSQYGCKLPQTSWMSPPSSKPFSHFHFKCWSIDPNQ